MDRVWKKQVKLNEEIPKEFIPIGLRMVAVEQSSSMTPDEKHIEKVRLCKMAIAQAEASLEKATKKIFINPDVKGTERACYMKQLKIYRESLKMMLEDNKARALRSKKS